MNGKRPSPGAASLRTLPAGVWALGLVSLLMDSSSELIHSLLPVYMSTVLGASMATIGIVEGAAEAAASITKVFSGVISDRLGRRKRLAVVGYGLAAITKPLFPLATGMGWVFTARFVDRIGKGIRGAPRDALVADLTPRAQLGAAYGLRQALDAIGAFAGPLAAVLLLAAFHDDLRAVLWVAVVPAFAAVAVLVVGVRDRAPGADAPARAPLSIRLAARMPLRYWLVVALGAVFTLARFSEAFLVLRVRDVGLGLGLVPVVLIVMNVVYAATAYPAGAASDRHSRRMLLIAGLGALVTADIALAAAASPPLALLGAALWGLHLGLTQGLFAKLVADTSDPERRGTAFGIFNLVGGGALLLASVIAGALWSAWGARATFLAGAAFASLAMLGLIALRGEPDAG